MKTASIVIPMYNESRYIGRCLQSLRDQSYKDFEVVLIDDGSTDDTIPKAKAFEGSLDLKVLMQSHGGPGKARNLGASESDGSILVFVDADMYFDQHFLRELLRPILDGSEIGTAHGVELVGNPENPYARAWSMNRIPRPTARSGVYRAILKDSFMAHGGFDTSKGYFDDDLSKVNGGKGALTVMEAICYHNNPEVPREIIKHSMWVGKSLVQTGHLKHYLVVYKYIAIAFLVALLILGCFLSPVSFVGAALLLILGFFSTKGFLRAHADGYSSHIVYVPMVMALRMIGVSLGIIRYLIIRK